jgi:hypothetical protein
MRDGRVVDRLGAPVEEVAEATEVAAARRHDERLETPLVMSHPKREPDTP